MARSFLIKALIGDHSGCWLQQFGLIEKAAGLVYAEISLRFSTNTFQMNGKCRHAEVAL
jgi:hypothetical protein